MPQVPNAQELALHSLLPTLHNLPPELLQLSTSLLAQSKSKAASLKPEEEIGRTYVCCHIACQRLGHKLALEVAKPSPPVKPKVYNKLHTYFNSVLATPKKVERSASTAAVSAASTKTTPSKDITSTPTSTRKRELDSLQDRDAASEASHHPESTPKSRRKYTAGHLEKGINAQMHPGGVIEASEVHGDDSIEGMQNEIDQQLNIETVILSKTPIRRKEKHGKPPVGRDEDVGAAGLLPGLGTMFQPAIDWLSEERRADFAEWKARINQEIKGLERRSELEVR